MWMKGKIQHYNLLNPVEVITCTCYGKTECTCGGVVEVTAPKVWVVFDPLYEKVLSVHSTEGGADSRCFEENEKEEDRRYYECEVQEFDLEG